MKQVMQLLMVIGIAILSLNIGVAWGITSKPVLDTDKCNHIIRYEDYSLECRITLEDAPDGDASTTIGATVHNPPLEVSEVPVGYSVGAEVQPATTAQVIQPTEEVQ